jgi:hypothetical protein
LSGSGQTQRDATSQNPPTFGGACCAPPAPEGSAHWKVFAFSVWHGPCIYDGVAPMVGSANKRGTVTMLATSTRNIATALAAAFISSLIFVSAAVSPLPIV